MNTLSTTARLVAAVAAGSITAGVFSVVVSFAEPQRSELIAKRAAATAVAAASAPVRLAQAR